MGDGDDDPGGGDQSKMPYQKTIKTNIIKILKPNIDKTLFIDNLHRLRVVGTHLLKLYILSFPNVEIQDILNTGPCFYR